MQASKPVEEVIGYLNSVSGYRSYLDSHNIPKGSVDDPIEILKETHVKSRKINTSVHAIISIVRVLKPKKNVDV